MSAGAAHTSCHTLPATLLKPLWISLSVERCLEHVKLPQPPEDVGGKTRPYLRLELSRCQLAVEAVLLVRGQHLCHAVHLLGVQVHRGGAHQRLGMQRSGQQGLATQRADVALAAVVVAGRQHGLLWPQVQLQHSSKKDNT